MSESFDPYLKWLSIPPDQQPPNHYRLLGVPLFIDDPDVIESAADRQMRHVRSFQSGRHSKRSQGILNEIAAARVCLLDPQKKAAYDAELKAKSQEIPDESKTADAVPRQPPPLPISGAVTTGIDLSPMATGKAPNRTGKRARLHPGLVVGGAAIAVLFIFSLIFYALTRTPATEPGAKKKTDEENRTARAERGDRKKTLEENRTSRPKPKATAPIKQTRPKTPKPVPAKPMQGRQEPSEVATPKRNDRHDESRPTTVPDLGEAKLFVTNSLNKAELYVNGQQVGLAQRDDSEFQCSLKLGDVIAVRLQEVAHSPSFAMNIRFDDGYVIPTHHTTWLAYTPANPDAWWQFREDQPAKPSKTAQNQKLPTDTFGTGCEAIWADYVYHTVNENDLRRPAPRFETKEQDSSSIAGVVSVRTKINAAWVYINEYFVCLAKGAKSSTETPVHLKAGDMIAVKLLPGHHSPSFSLLFQSVDGEHTIVSNRRSWHTFEPSNPVTWWIAPKLSQDGTPRKAGGPIPEGAEGLGCEAIWGKYVYYLVKENDLR